MFSNFSNNMPEWMKKYLDILPSMLPGIPSLEDQIKEIKKYMTYEFPEDAKLNGLDGTLWSHLNSQIQILESLHREDMLK